MEIKTSEGFDEAQVLPGEVIVFSKSNQVCVGYIDPVNIVFSIRTA